jgi:hypothetical protein
MTPQEIQERNKQIALMLGAATKQMMGVNAWVLEEDELNLSFDIFNEKLFSNNGGSGWKIKDLQFHSDWNWLMESVEFIEKLGYESILGGSEYYYPYKDMRHNQTFFKDDTTIYHESKDKKEAVFIAVSDFAKLYNEKKL